MVKSGADSQDFARDSYQCERDMRQSGYYRTGLAGQIYAMDFAESAWADLRVRDLSVDLEPPGHLAPPVPLRRPNVSGVVSRHSGEPAGDVNSARTP